MNHFKEYGVVRVIKLDRPNRHFDGTESVKRPPQMGDIGTIVHISPGTQGMSSRYIVECLDKNGFTVWLAEFTMDEFEFVEAAK
jgi:hypothetical protein